jgi:hypothetical protein
MTSPFLPGTKIQFAWDSTSLGWFKECPRLYQYYMIEGWSPKGERIHLKYGQLYHSGLELYDKLRCQSLSHDDALNEVVSKALYDTWEYPVDTEQNAPNQLAGGGKPWTPDHTSKTRETLIRSLIWYLEQFGSDDPAETVVLANGKPAVELSFKMELDWGPAQSVMVDGPVSASYPGEVINTKAIQPYILCGHLDRVVNFAGGTYVMDRKTTGSALGSNYFDQYDPDNQMSLYSMAAQVIYQTPVKGVIIDAAQIMVGFTRFGRGFTYRTPTQTDEWLSDVERWLRLAEQYATEGYWPMNDKSCHKYGGCTFRKICSKSPEVRQKFLESDFEKREWNPLEPR